MIQRNFETSQKTFALKRDFEKLETNIAHQFTQVMDAIETLPDKLLDKLSDRASILQRLDRLEKHAGIKAK